MSKKLVDAMAEMREGDALSIAETLVERGEDPLGILEDCRKAMEIVGERYEKGDYFLPELMLAGEMLMQITEMVKPKLAEGPEGKKAGKVVIGTVEGDIHDIGKNIVTFMLDVNGFDVRDLGVDVPADKFIEAIRDFKPQVVGLSGFLTLAFDVMKDTVDAIESAGLRDKVKIMIGGGQMGDSVRDHAGADAYGENAMVAVSLARGWVGAK
jgi:methanogenic corrinoid protein MtbC1